MPAGGHAGRPPCGNAGGGLATALITTADMTAFRLTLLVTLRLPNLTRPVTGRDAAGRLAGATPATWPAVTHSAWLVLYLGGWHGMTWATGMAWTWAAGTA
jgi:hypothetical protein